MNPSEAPSPAGSGSGPGPGSGPGSAPAPAAPRGRWLREPLLHFLLLGALLFGIDQWRLARQDDPDAIVITRAVDQEARDLFTASRGHPPGDDELRVLRQRWLDNEVLYREGLALRVDQGDSAIRERVIFKSLSVIDAGVKLPPYDDEVLRRWFEARRARYDEPPRFDFQEAVLSGDSSETALKAFVRELNAGAPGDARAGLRVFKSRPRDNLVQSYGPEFARALEEAPVGEWLVQPTQAGLRAIRVDAVTPARPADFERLRGVVLQDWTDATLAGQRSAAVRALTRKYRIRYEDGVQ